MIVKKQQDIKNNSDIYDSNLFEIESIHTLEFIQNNIPFRWSDGYFKNSLKIRRRKIYTKGFLLKLKKIKKENEEKYELIMGKLNESKKVRS